MAFYAPSVVGLSYSGYLGRELRRITHLKGFRSKLGVQVLGTGGGGMKLCPQRGPGAEPLVSRSGGEGDQGTKPL